MKNLTHGTKLIAEERQKQIDKHGFTAEHHVNHPEFYENDQLARAAVALLLPIGSVSNLAWPQTPENWDSDWFSNLMQRSHEERLVIAGALIAAELDRLNLIDEK